MLHTTFGLHKAYGSANASSMAAVLLREHRSQSLSTIEAVFFFFLTFSTHDWSHVDGALGSAAPRAAVRRG